MAEIGLYDRLLRLPLFLGMSRADLQQVAGHTKFDFKKYAAQTHVVNEGDMCKSLYFLLNGDIHVMTEADDHGYRVVEDLAAPEIFQTESVFGLRQRFTHTYVAKSDCSVMCISKQDILRLFDQFEIFRINLLNLVSTLSQKQGRRLWNVPPKSLEERIVRFFETHCVRPAGEKIFYVNMNRLAEELNDSRLDISRALHTLQSQQLLHLYRGRIHIPALEKLINQQKECVI